MKKLLKILQTFPLIAALIIVCLVVFGTLLGPTTGKQSMAYQIESINRMQQMALAVTQYKSDHKGNGPSQLADLYPTYIDDVSFFFFESPYSTSTKPPENLMGAQGAVSAYSPYVYLPLAKGRFVIFERPGLWRSRKVVDYVMDDDRGGDFFSHHQASIDNFEHLLGEGFPEVSGSTSRPAEQ